MCSMLALPRWDCSYSQTLSCTPTRISKADSKSQIRKDAPTPTAPNCTFDVSRQPRVRGFWPFSGVPFRLRSVFQRSQSTRGEGKCSEPGDARLAWEKKVILSPSRYSLVLSNHDSHKPRASREHLKQLPAPSLQPPASSGSVHWQPPRRLETIAISEVPGCRI
ncbi:predicted protein [Aspergillus nidulans FGSC A4]|uniref:Uncharacterized protein n=1 Tax=Emericella nidulans (strain FGSC A4 / ATCC 38163 / CBS 112.46 / NRRL 194 / M139) TaxID=227321 RepID=Q5AVY4_EMENI|nr:hypothetical protein [Aspergillus nidulans FGSC A4]EAA62126.1 predicted protein [Aspergillus nidulans FGSC A4]CBF79607.1 TPA: conserved hypothetical protein [Aspergillus nidulans FGSC A4]|eukprot:XP_680815.1 predicted protein [Aspergillus nidulans FGSC A4]